jgi:hypothetical protein
MASWLIRYEAFPEKFESSLGGYEGLISRDVLMLDSWMRIMFKGSPIGFSHSTMGINESDPALRHVVKNHLTVRMKVMGLEQQILADTDARLDDQYKLQQFAFSMTAKDYNIRIAASRAGKDTFDLTMRTPYTKRSSTITVPRDVVIYSPMTEMAVKKLRPGQKLTIRTLDPMSLSTAKITFHALRKEPITVGDRTYTATVLSSDYHGGKALSWIDESGIILRQETPFGWTMEKCTMEEAFEALAESDGAEDMLTGLAVRCDGSIPASRSVKKLRLRLAGVDFGKHELLSERQTVEHSGDDETVLSVTADQLPGSESAELHIADDDREFLRSSLSIQCDHSDIIAQAERITDGLDDPVSKATAIYNWVNRNVVKEITVSLPSALDVLRTMKGDCNEHTYLYVALARAAGLPARVTVGLAYQDGAFYYHAWPTVYVGEWHEMDPTWGQESVDATHIAIIQGELASQLELVKVMGRLRIQVLPAKEESNNGKANRGDKTER